MRSIKPIWVFAHVQNDQHVFDKKNGIISKEYKTIGLYVRFIFMIYEKKILCLGQEESFSILEQTEYLLNKENGYKYV